MNRSIILILGATIACAASNPVIVTTLAEDAFPVRIPDGRPCSMVLDVPIAESTVHVQMLAEIDNVTTDPPTSGKHFADWAAARVYDEPVADGLQIHNLEHGHVVVQYRDVNGDQLDEIRAAVEVDAAMVLMAPRPTMPWALALTSWGKIQVCKEVPPDVGAMVQAFVADNRDNAPESIP